MVQQGCPILVLLCVNGKVARHNTGSLLEVTGTLKKKTHDSMLFNHAFKLLCGPALMDLITSLFIQAPFTLSVPECMTNALK